jgi:hypothetical protein
MRFVKVEEQAQRMKKPELAGMADRTIHMNDGRMV